MSDDLAKLADARDKALASLAAMERALTQMQATYDAATDRFHAIERRLLALELHASIGAGSVATKPGTDSDPVVITDAEANAPR
jgi:hypothetical protein